MKQNLWFVALLLLGGCEPTAYWDGRPATKMVDVSEHVSEVVVPLNSRPGPLPAQDVAALRAAIQREEAGATVSLDVLMPPDANAAAVGAMQRAVATLGIPADRIKREQSADLPWASSVVRIHAVRMKAPTCAGVPSSSTEDMQPLNLRHYVLGCASANNFAAMVADPRDLSAPSSLPQVDGDRVNAAFHALQASNYTGQRQANGGGGSSSSGSAAAPSSSSGSGGSSASSGQ